MKEIFTSIRIAARIWIISSLVFGAGWLLVSIFFANPEFLPWWTFSLATVGATVGSLPLLLMLIIVVPWIERFKIDRNRKIINLVIACLMGTLAYGILGGLFFFAKWSYETDWLAKYVAYVFSIAGILFTCSVIALSLTGRRLTSYFTSHSDISSFDQNNNMETTQHPETIGDNNNQTSKSNKILIKAAITGALILLMLIPTAFITNLVNERQTRHQEVATEVSSKWALAQTLTGPYLYIPYKTYYKDKDGKTAESDNYLWILPDNLTVSGRIDHEIRPRSIYKVLLYRSSIQETGNFILQIPKDIDVNTVQWTDAKVCYGLSDFKGIEEKITIKVNGTAYELSPGLPANEIDSMGLSAPVNLSATDIGKVISFDSKLKIKGSGQLHFVPLAGNSSFTLTSKWPNPSFDGNNLPSERNVTTAGFDAKWSFNKANLPFGTVLKDFKFDQNSIAFGVTMLEPADQYAKTDRCIKYAILFIGLTFSLFFIVELMQKKPVHPVQYVLIGLALVIFYTLLLSISEFILFDYAYMIAAAGTILLITLYARSHFNSWKSAGIFGGVLSILYGFIFILIRLEDTALLVGSIGLFFVLALVMYASRKINWYGTTAPASES